MTLRPSQHKEKSPLGRLVLFIVCLAIAASLVTGTWYGAVVLPQQKALQTPENSGCVDRCDRGCSDTLQTCFKDSLDRKVCMHEQQQCENSCISTCACTDCQDQCMEDFRNCQGDRKACEKTWHTCENSCPCSG
jgi:hypothetical protein